MRECYVALFPVLWDLFKKSGDDTVTFTLTGTPGIGKSVFGLLFLIELTRFLKASGASPVNLAEFGRGLSGRIVYEHASDTLSASTFYLIDVDAETIFRSYDTPTEWLSNQHTFLIKDGPCGSLDVDCSVLWISSPRAGSFQKAGERGEGVFILPPWEADELVKCWSMDCTKDVFNLRDKEADQEARSAMEDALHTLDDDADEEAKNEAILRRWAADLGPVARRVFAPAKAYQALKGALGADLGDLEALATVAESHDTGGDHSKFQHSHRLLLMIPSADFTIYRFAPSSVSIGRKILHKKLSSDLESARSLMGRMGGAHLGLVFEPYAHFVLAKGGSFTIRSLADGGGEETFEMPACETVDIHSKDLDALVLELLKYYIPVDPTFAVIDAWCRHAMFQMTVSLNHPIKSGSKQFKALKGKGPNCIIFVVPKSIAANFKLQHLVKSNGEVSMPAGGWNDVKQFVLGL